LMIDLARFSLTISLRLHPLRNALVITHARVRLLMGAGEKNQQAGRKRYYALRQ
jgi:hypothetical protein